jgi:hypothetical protein
VPDVEIITSYDAHDQIVVALREREGFENALAAIDAVLSSNIDFDSPSELSRWQLLYERALMLEILGRDDEAQAAYLAVYDGSPEERWQILAALHLEWAKDEG